MQTKLTRLLGIRHPIIQGGMAWIADASLASAVSNAGGLGIISAMNAGADWVREEIRKCRTMTDKPFGVNIMLMSPHVEEVAAMVAEEKVPVVTTGAGNPSRFVKMWKEAGVKILPVVASTALAKMVERAGVDAVIAEGGESGGHVGDLTTMALVPRRRGGRHRRRPRHGRGVRAGRLRRADGHALPRRGRMHRLRRV